MIFKILTLCCLVFLFYQDMRYRAVYWVVFPLLTVLLLWLLPEGRIFKDLMEHSIYNLVFLALQLTLLSVYFSIKSKRLINITSQHIGWGDLLFLASIAFYLSPVNYLAFYTVSLVIVLIFSVLTNPGLKEKTIPLAGLQALLFAFLIFIDWNYSLLDLTSDNWLINKIVL